MRSPATAQLNSDNQNRTKAIELLSELPPSAKLVAKVLDYNDPLSQKQIQEKTLLPGRTVRYALNRLEEVDIIESRPLLRDARKRYYSLKLDN